MNIRIFSHVLDWTGDTSILLEQTELLEKTGLVDAANEVNMMLHFKEDNFIWLKDRWKDKTNIKYHLFDESYRNWCEATTMHHIQELVHSTNEEFYVMYLSHKGVTHDLNDLVQINWRSYMQYWNVEKWKECVNKLDGGYETCGASFLTTMTEICPFYAGNVFWAKASYLRRCRRLKTPPENNYQPQFDNQGHHRYDLEYWHGSGDPKWFDMHPGKFPGEKDFRWLNSPDTYRE